MSTPWSSVQVSGASATVGGEIGNASPSTGVAGCDSWLNDWALAPFGTCTPALRSCSSSLRTCASEGAPRAALGYGDYDTVMDVVAKGVVPGPYIMGEQFTAADVAIGSGLRFGMMFKLIPERPEFTAYVARLAGRPALKQATAKDEALSKA